MFQIDTDALRYASYSLQDGSNELNKDYYRIEDAKSMLYGLSSMGQVISQLNRLQGDVKKEAMQERKLYDTAQMIARRYADCEESIIENMDNGKFGFGVTSPRRINFSLSSIFRKHIDERTLRELLRLFY